MKRKLAFLLVIAMLVAALPTAGFAAGAEDENDTVKTGITPDSWLYGFDGFLKELQLFFTFNTVDKAGLLHDISDERLAEAREMIEKNKAEYGTVAIKAYKAALERAIKVMDKAILDGKDISEVAAEFSNTLTDRWSIIKWVLERIPEEDREKLNIPLQDVLEDITVTIEVVEIDDDEEAEEDTDTEENPAGDEDETGGTNDDGSAKDPEDETAVEDKTTKDDETADEDETTGGDETDTEDETPDVDLISICSLKKLVTAKILEETVGEKGAKLYIDGILNNRQVLAVYAMALQTEKDFDEVLEVFLANRGLGSTAKALGLKAKDALKGVKTVFKAVKAEIKEQFKAVKLAFDEYYEDMDDEVPGTVEDEQGDLSDETGEDETSQDPVNDPDDEEGTAKDDKDEDEEEDDDDDCGRDRKRVKEKEKDHEAEKKSNKNKAKEKEKHKEKDREKDKDDDDDKKSSKKNNKNEKAQSKGNNGNGKGNGNCKNRAGKFMERVIKLLCENNGKAKGRNKK